MLGFNVNCVVLTFSVASFVLFLVFYTQFSYETNITTFWEGEEFFVGQDKEEIVEIRAVVKEPYVNTELNKPEFHSFVGGSEPEQGEFLPGSLNISKEETLRKCYLPPSASDSHRGKQQCVISDKYKMNFFLVPKTGSSTNRVAFKENLEGHEKQGSHGAIYCNQKLTQEQRSYVNVVTIREPLSRFYSQYMEAEFRAEKDGGKMTRMKFWDLDEKKNKTSRFLKFVDYWHENSMDETLDTHLRLQAPMMSWYDGSVHRIDWFMPIEEMDDKWNELKEFLELDLPPKVSVARKNNHPSIDKAKIPDEYNRKICQIIAIDYCCLNYKLPEVCEGTITCEYKPRLDLPGATKYVFAKVLEL